MARKVVESEGLKSGWCLFPLHDTKQHEGCKEVFEVRGFPTWECACACHGESATPKQEPEKLSPKDRAAVTEGK